MHQFRAIKALTGTAEVVIRPMVPHHMAQVAAVMEEQQHQSAVEARTVQSVCRMDLVMSDDHPHMEEEDIRHQCHITMDHHMVMHLNNSRMPYQFHDMHHQHHRFHDTHHHHDHKSSLHLLLLLGQDMRSDHRFDELHDRHNRS